MWDLICLVSWDDNCFLSVLNSASPVCFLRLNWNKSVPPKKKTRCYRFHYRKNILPFIHALLLIQLHSMNLVLDQHPIQLAALFCDSRTKPICNKNPEEPFLEIYVKGGERDHIKGRERPQMLGIQEERSHMSLRGERHVHIWLFAFALIFFALIFCSLSSPSIPC